MKKMSLLVIALLAGLPGCGCRKQQEAERVRREPVEQYMDADVEIEDLTTKNRMKKDFDEDEEMEEDEDGMDELTEEDLASFNFDDEGLNLDEFNEEDFTEDMNTDEFAWIDAQTDDEFKRLYFSFNHYGVRADQKEALNYDIEQVQQLLAESGATQPTVVIEGHACQEGTPAYNLALSERRAKAVADLFVAAGIDRSVIKVVGRGQECPMVINGRVVNGNRQEREPNRRVEVRVIYT